MCVYIYIYIYIYIYDISSLRVNLCTIYTRRKPHGCRGAVKGRMLQNRDGLLMCNVLKVKLFLMEVFRLAVG